MATDAEAALETIFARDSAMVGGMTGRPPRVPMEPAKKPEGVKKAEAEAFQSFVYVKPDWKEKKEAIKTAEEAATEKVRQEGIASVYERTGQFKGGMHRPPRHEDSRRPTISKLPKEVIHILDDAYLDYVKGNKAEYDKKMNEVDAAIKSSVQEKGIAGLYAPVKVAPLKGGVTRRNTTSGGDIVTSLLTIRNQIKLYHWQTGSFARHKATDDLTAALDLAIDNFVEVYMGRYGRPKVSKTIKLSNYTEAEAQRFVAKQRKFLSEVLPRKIKKGDTDLLNIRDEILAELNKVLYLFTLA
jgi:hypothetical protein